MDLASETWLEHLGLTPRDLGSVVDPFGDLAAFHKDPAAYSLRLMRKPEFFYFTCKHLLNIELPPYQCVILQEMWNHPFPMLIGSRGLGKSFLLGLYALLRALFIQGRKIVITGSGFRQAKTVFAYAENIWHNSPMLQSLVAENSRSGPHHDADRWTLRLADSTITALPVGDGCVHGCTRVTYRDRFGMISDHATSDQITPTESVSLWGDGRFRRSDESYNNGIKPTKVVRTVMGYSFESTHNHRMKVVRDGAITWVRADEMIVGDKIPIDRSWRWHEGDEDVRDADAYALGLMLGDGNFTSRTNLGFATVTPELIPPLDAGTGMIFKQTGDLVHWKAYGIDRIAAWLGRWEMTASYTIDKALPAPMLRAGRHAMTACLSGLFDTDGGVQVTRERGGVGITVRLTNTSEALIDQVQYILLHYGIVSSKTWRDRDERWNRAFELLISGYDVALFARHIGFRLSHKAADLEGGLADKARIFSMTDYIPGVQAGMVAVSARNRIVKGCATPLSTSVSASKIARRVGITHRLARAFLEVYGHIDDSSVGRVRLLARDDVYYDEITSIEDSECETFDVHVPDGHEYCAGGFFSHNTRVRGERAHDLIADEFASISWEIFEVVFSGFSVVSLNPVQRSMDMARIRVLKRKGLWTEEHAEEYRKIDIPNQTLISGTAYYQFNHFAKYWERWKGIVESRGDPRKIQLALGGVADEKLHWKDYAVIRIPHDMIPEGHYDDKQVARSRSTSHLGIAQMEYGAVFTKDSNGFYKRSLIETCVTTTPVTPAVAGGEPVQFDAVTRGNPARSYVYGVDPASESDSFAIVVLELHADHRRVVFCWTTNKERFNAKIKSGYVDEKDYYGYCARKIRELMKTFPCEAIALDSQGGGVAVMEALHDPDKIKPGEHPLWPVTPDHVLSDGKDREVDVQHGLHMVELVNFARAEYVFDANHGMRKDLEDRVLLFPQNNPVILAVAAEEDAIRRRMFDTLEDCHDEIEELKDELTTIVHGQTSGTNRPKWDTPEVKLAGMRKGRLRKDRYSALLMANHAARRIHRQFELPEQVAYGGFSDRIVLKGHGEEMYSFAPDWFRKATEGDYDGYGVAAAV